MEGLVTKISPMDKKMIQYLKKLIRRIVPLRILLYFYNKLISFKCVGTGYKVVFERSFYRIINQNREIWLSKRHAIYLEDTIKNFDFYYEGVVAVEVGDRSIVNYSLPAWHQVKSFNEMPVFFPAFAEPVITTKQYVDFASLSEGSVVIDLGAYSGLTSIIFSNAMNNKGLVIAVEADEGNYIACEKNINLHNKIFNDRIQLIHAAVWKNCDGIEFSVEGNMGSSVIDVVGEGRAKTVKVPTITLDKIARDFNLKHIDFIKCDIEGAELEIFDSPLFFGSYRPKIMIECHSVSGNLTSAGVKAILSRYGYSCELVEQIGYPLPLLMCTPT